MSVDASGPGPDLSPEARRFLEENRAARIPRLNRLTVKLLRPLVARGSRKTTARARRDFAGDIVNGAVAGVRVVELHPTGADPDGDVLVFLHGGAFAFGAALDPIALQLAAATGLTTYSVEYDLAPEARFPTALHQCRDVWVDIASRTSGRAVLAGASAGATLALGVVQLLRETPDGGPLPAALVAMTPLAEARAEGGRDVNEGRDPLLRWRGQVDRVLPAYVGRASADDPLLSPARADWRGLDVPTLLTTGGIDLLRWDALRLDATLREHGVPVVLDDAPGLWHAYQNRPELPEARASYERIAAFVASALAR